MDKKEDRLAPSEEQFVHLDLVEQRKDIFDYQVETCPTCKSSLEQCFGMAGGGMGVYGFCPKCERVIWKCQVAD